MAPNVEISMDWQLACGEIKKRSAYLLQTELWSDCTFLVGLEPDQVQIKAHKLILGMASPVFEAMFYGSMAEGNNVIIAIPDMHPEAFKGLLEYIYTDNIELDSFDMACMLYYAAQKYMLPHLLTVCTMYLSCNLVPQNACDTYEFAKLVGEAVLMVESLQLIKTETKLVLSDISFEEIEIDTVVEVFSLESLNIDNELVLFAAAERYAKAQYKKSLDGAETNIKKLLSSMLGSTKNDVDEDTENEQESENCVNVNMEQEQSTSGENAQQNPDEKNETNYNKTLIQTQVYKSVRKALQKIRFLTLSARQLAEYETLNSLLTTFEILAIFMNLASHTHSDARWLLDLQGCKNHIKNTKNED